MKFIFVDAENIGLKVTESIKASTVDKVLVFSKDDAARKLCERKLFVNLSDYSAGANQADFYIVRTLAGILNSLSLDQVKTSQFVLYSKDKALASAFSFQCTLHKAKVAISLPSSPADNIVSINQSVSLEDRLLSFLETPTKCSDLEKQLNMSKADLTRAMNNLIKEGKIQRSSTSKKNWIATDCAR